MASNTFRLKGKPVFVWNFFNLERTRWEGQEAVSSGRHTLPIILPFDESLDVRSDTGTPVVDADYQVPFAFNGRIQTLTLGRPKLTPADIQRLQGAAETANDH